MMRKVRKEINNKRFRKIQHVLKFCGPGVVASGRVLASIYEVISLILAPHTHTHTHYCIFAWSLNCTKLNDPHYNKILRTKRKFCKDISQRTQTVGSWSLLGFKPWDKRLKYLFNISKQT